MALGACKIRSGCNIPQVPIQYYTTGGTKVKELSPHWRIKTVMACVRTILRDESETVSNSPLRFSSPTPNLTYLLN